MGGGESHQSHTPTPRPAHHQPLSPVFLLSICGLITNKSRFCISVAGIARRNQFIPQLSLACQPHIQLLLRNYEEVTSQISFTGKTGSQLKLSEYTDCGIHSIWIIALFELFNTNAKLLVVLGRGGISGISKGRWGKNITVQIKPWVLNFKHDMHYSWLITSGSDCTNTNCKWWWNWQMRSKHKTFKM